MPGVPSVFSLEKISLTAVIAFAVSLITLFILRRRGNNPSIPQAVILSFIVGFSVLAWRMAGNVAQLNDDPIPPFSPNDLLCPIITYMLLDIYAAFHRPTDMSQWEKTRAWLMAVSFVVNVLFI